ncbi:MAG: hypothetical protein ACREVW_13415 [Burkholderiales bacterium]
MRQHHFMKLDSMTETFDLMAARAGSRPDWVRVMTLSLVVTGSFLLQGCLAGAWVALVAVDTMRSSNVTVGSFEQSWVSQVAVNTMRGSNVTFGPFEQSWVAQQDQSSDAVHNPKVTSVAVLPVEGDPEMGARLATLLQQETSLRVESPATVSAGDTAADPRSAKADDADRSALAKEITRDLGVDTILVSRVADAPSHPSDWGWKAEGSRRLYLYLVNHEGHLLWKDELPFTLVNGSTPPLEASVQIDLAHHVMQQVKALHLDELGYLPNKEKRRKSSRPPATLIPIE